MIKYTIEPQAVERYNVSFYSAMGAPVGEFLSASHAQREAVEAFAEQAALILDRINRYGTDAVL